MCGLLQGAMFLSFVNIITITIFAHFVANSALNLRIGQMMELQVFFGVGK